MKENRTTINAFETFRRSLIPTVLTASCLLAPFTCFAADFVGTLDSVSITDAQGTNAPPTASFLYTIEGNTVTFDASESVDSDGTITEYKWAFSDGTTDTGVTVTHQYSNTSDMNATLTLADNNNAITITQQTVNLSSNQIEDTFEQDTQNDYTTKTGSLDIHDGKAWSAKVYTRVVAYHNTSLQSNDQIVEGTVRVPNAYFSGIRFRWDPENNTGYQVAITGSYLVLYKFSNEGETYIYQVNGGYIKGSSYTIRAEITGNSIQIYVDDVLQIDKMDNSYPYGTYVGFTMQPHTTVEDTWIDNLAAEAK
jgi:PKD repeat protein